MELDIHTYQKIFEYVTRDGDPRGAYLAMICRALYHGLTFRKLPVIDKGWRQDWVESRIFRGIETIVLTAADRGVCSVSHFKFAKRLIMMGVRDGQKYVNTDRGVRLPLIRDLALTNSVVNQQLIQGLASLETLVIHVPAPGTDAIDFSFLRKLKTLRITAMEGLTDESIRGLDLEELSLDYVKGIKNISHLTNLRKLSLTGTQVSSEGWDRLNLEELTVYSSPECHLRIRHMGPAKPGPFGAALPPLMSNLTRLDVREMDITQEDIETLNLTYLNVSDCPGVRSVSHMSKLKVLFADGECGITDGWLRGVTGLKYLSVYDNPRIAASSLRGAARTSRSPWD